MIMRACHEPSGRPSNGSSRSTKDSFDEFAREFHAALIANALNLPKIVHPRRTRPPGIGPPRTSCATTSSSYASTRGDQGLGDPPPGPFS
jgi:hypothetical protein